MLVFMQGSCSFHLEPSRLQTFVAVNLVIAPSLIHEWERRTQGHDQRVHSAHSSLASRDITFWVYYLSRHRIDSLQVCLQQGSSLKPEKPDTWTAFQRLKLMLYLIEQEKTGNTLLKSSRGKFLLKTMGRSDKRQEESCARLQHTRVLFCFSLKSKVHDNQTQSKYKYVKRLVWIINYVMLPTDDRNLSARRRRRIYRSVYVWWASAEPPFLWLLFSYCHVCLFWLFLSPHRHSSQ